MDIQELHKKNLEEWAEARLKLWPTTGLDSHKDEINEFVNLDKFRGWGAWSSDKLIGFIEVYIRPFANGCESRPVPFLEGIWVDSGYRESGVSTKLLAEAEKWLIENGYNEMGSDADISNEISIKVHGKWGFEETERVVYFRKKLNS